MNLRENMQYFGNHGRNPLPAEDSLRASETPALAGSTLNQFSPGEILEIEGWEKLPSLATSSDVREVVRILMDKPAGLPIMEVLKFEPRRIFEARKLAAYEYWGVISREGNRVELTPLSHQLAGMIAAESRVFARVLIQIPPYLEAIEWVRQRRLKTVTHDDIAGFWNGGNGGTEHSRQGPNYEAEVVSFFSICQAAALGVATLGKRGQPARLKIEPEKVEQFLLDIKNDDAGNFPASAFDYLHNVRIGNASRLDSPALQRIYVSGTAGGNMLKHLCSSLDLADFEGIVADGFFENNFPGSANLETLRSCQAGVFVVGDADCSVSSSGRTEMAGERLTEIVAALALFDGRVVVIWNSPLAPPEELLRQPGSHVLAGEDEIKASFRTVKLLKAMKSSGDR